MHEQLIAIAATRDGFRRLQSGLSSYRLQHCTLADCLAFCRAERPQLLILEVHPRWSFADSEYARRLLSELRNARTRAPRIILYLASPEVALHAGSLLFSSDSSLDSSALIDSFIVTTPWNSREGESVQQQAANAAAQLFESITHEDTPLPSLGESSWAPTLASPQSLDLWFRWLPRYAKYINESPLIVGETGTGKTSLAAALHLVSGRTGPFVSITPRDFSSVELVQAELFGAVVGAYTGAVDKWGLVKKAEGGTLFIDELQSIDVELQGKLITFIEDKRYRRVGAAEQHSADVRFVFASNKSLAELVETGKLRDDFAYRLERLQLRVLPLRERRLDVVAGLCRALAVIHRVRPRRGPTVEGFSQEALRLLFAARWPGNLRQLENVVAHCVENSLAEGSRVVTAAVARDALEHTLGGYEAHAEEVLARAMESVLKAVRGGLIRTPQEAAVRVATTARSIALEACAGDAQRAASLLGEEHELLRRLEELQQ